MSEENVSMNSEDSISQADARKWKEHSIMLNQAIWDLGEALGHIQPGEDSVMLDGPTIVAEAVSVIKGEPTPADKARRDMIAERAGLAEPNG